MSPGRSPRLRAVPPSDPLLDMAEDIYRHGRERALDREHWAKLHIRSDRSPAISLGERARRIMLGSGLRVERGGIKFDERRP